MEQLRKRLELAQIRRLEQRRKQLLRPTTRPPGSVAPPAASAGRRLPVRPGGQRRKPLRRRRPTPQAGFAPVALDLACAAGRETEGVLASVPAFPPVSGDGQSSGVMSPLRRGWRRARRATVTVLDYRTAAKPVTPSALAGGWAASSPEGRSLHSLIGASHGSADGGRGHRPGHRRRQSRREHRAGAAADRQEQETAWPAAAGVSILRPVCGLEHRIEETLAASFRIDHPSYEVIFCVGRRRPGGAARAAPDSRTPAIPARLLVGNEGRGRTPSCTTS